MKVAPRQAELAHQEAVKAQWLLDVEARKARTAAAFAETQKRSTEAAAAEAARIEADRVEAARKKAEAMMQQAEQQRIRDMTGKERDAYYAAKKAEADRIKAEEENRLRAIEEERIRVEREEQQRLALEEQARVDEARRLAAEEEQRQLAADQETARLHALAQLPVEELDADDSASIPQSQVTPALPSDSNRVTSLSLSPPPVADADEVSQANVASSTEKPAESTEEPICTDSVDDQLRTDSVCPSQVDVDSADGGAAEQAELRDGDPTQLKPASDTIESQIPAEPTPQVDTDPQPSQPREVAPKRKKSRWSFFCCGSDMAEPQIDTPPEAKPVNRPKNQTDI